MKKTIRSFLTVLIVLSVLVCTLAVSVGAANPVIYSKEYKDGVGNVVISAVSTAPELDSCSLRVTNVTYNYSGFESSAGYRKVLLAYDIDLNDGTVDLNSASQRITFKVKLPANIEDGTEVELYRMTAKDEGKRLISTVKDGCISFATSSLGVYAVAVKADAPIPYVAPDYTWLVVLIIIAVAILLVLGIILLIKRIRAKKNAGDDTSAPIPAPAAPVEEPVAPAAEEAAEVEVIALEQAAEPEAEQIAEAAPAPEAEPEAPAVEAAPAPVEPEKPVIVLNFVDEAEGGAAVEEAVSVRFRTSFESRYIQSGALQDYYSPIKNALLSYKGVKARTSWNYESFNKGRVQCAKINFKGNALLVYLALDPANYNAKKYHFNDMTGKPKFADVPMLMKVKSDRALKYTLELIEEMMKVLEIPAGEAASVDYHVPYETTEQLAARGLVKVIAPTGTTLGENATVKKTNVGAMLSADSEQ